MQMDRDTFRKTYGTQYTVSFANNGAYRYVIREVFKDDTDTHLFDDVKSAELEVIERNKKRISSISEMINNENRKHEWLIAFFNKNYRKWIERRERLIAEANEVLDDIEEGRISRYITYEPLAETIGFNTDKILPIGTELFCLRNKFEIVTARITSIRFRTSWFTDKDPQKTEVSYVTNVARDLSYVKGTNNLTSTYHGEIWDVSLEPLLTKAKIEFAEFEEKTREHLESWENFEKSN